MIACASTFTAHNNRGDEHAATDGTVDNPSRRAAGAVAFAEGCEMSDTPRTDEQQYFFSQFGWKVSADFARALERECAALRMALLESRQYVDEPHLHFSTISTVPIVMEPCPRCELLDRIDALSGKATTEKELDNV